MSVNRGVQPGEGEGLVGRPPAWKQDSAREDQPLSELRALRSAGEGEARTWKVGGRKQGPRVLGAIWAEADTAIREAIRKGRQFSAEEAESFGCGDLQTHSRLLEAALAGAHELLNSRLRLPEVETQEKIAVPRAYAAVNAYLRGSQYKFDATTFVAFLRGMQSVYPLALRELWALKALVQLVLLEQLGHAAQALWAEIENPRYSGGNGESPEKGLPGLVASLRASDIAPWKEICQTIGEVDAVLHDDPCGVYPRMSSETRETYLQAVHQLGGRSVAEETEIAKRALALARMAQNHRTNNVRAKERRSHVGYYLIGEGRTILERQIRYRAPLAERVRKTILAGADIYYFVGIELLTFAIIAFLVIGARAPLSLIAALILISLPATEAAWGMMNQITALILSPRVLPKMDFSEGIPADCATMVVVPTLLLSEAYTRRMVTELEVRFLGNRTANLYFALVTDAPDSPRPDDESDELVLLCSNLIQELNSRYGGKGDTPFFFFHRSRTFNPSEESWMGWERKRGKLLDLNDLLRGAKDSFPVKVGNLSILPRIKYVIPVDSDTQLPRGVARKLVATIAHPLNRAVIDARSNTVVEGYGILQPRVGISVQSAGRSLLATIYSGQTGIDFYARAVSDIYQDLFGEGTFVGKGIYEVDIFRQVLGNRFPWNAILSHDLIEGNYTRAGLVSDLEVIDDYPTHFSAYSRRKHRWMRGDWQIMQWLFRRVPDAFGRRVPNPLSLLARWKIFDNLRRSLVEVATLVLLLAGWLFLPGSPRRWTLVVLVLLLIPVYLQLAVALVKLQAGQGLMGRLKGIADSFIAGQINVFFMLAFLTHQTLVALDAILRTIVRVTITRKKLLEWETAAQSEMEERRTPVDRYLAWTPWFSLAIGALLAVVRPVALPDAAPFLILWASAGPLARWLNRPPRSSKAGISREDQVFLRIAALRTWRFFRESASPDENGLAPDFVQERPPDVAHRISPTNLGLLLNVQLAGLELGYLTLPEFVRQAEAILETAKCMRRFRGHFLNWYDTRTLEPASPAFVSSVDSGNLACSLWALKQGCLKAIQQPLLRDSTLQGLRDHVTLLEELVAGNPGGSLPPGSVGKISAQMEVLGEHGSAWVCALPGLAQDLRDLGKHVAGSCAPSEELNWWMAQAVQRAEATQDMIERLLPWLLAHNRSLLNHLPNTRPKDASALTLRSLWAISADLDANLEELAEDSKVDPILRFTAKTLHERLPRSLAEADKFVQRLKDLAEEADRLVQEMDFRFLYNPGRKALSVGYDVDHQSVAASCYDLLASEARSATFVAIAKGDIPQECWFQLGRDLGLWNGENVLLSWSGTMFEYLMPTIWFKDYPRSLLGEGLRAAVRCHRKWTPGKGMPWGISECACSALNRSGHYYYQAFGVPVLSLDPNACEDIVIAPYATFLALAVDGHQAVQNLRRMADLNWLGEKGFYDAVDFTPSRIGSDQEYEVVPTWMAHHQGMSLLAACNLLTDGTIQKLFHSEPAIRATELLLQEKPLLATHVIAGKRQSNLKEHGGWHKLTSAFQAR